MTLRRLVVLNLALLSLMILASRLALVVHEVGGHAVPARALGARSVEIRLSPLGGGYVTPTFPERQPPSPTGTVIFCLGGIALNLVTGVAAWIGARRLAGRGLLYVALLFLGAGSVAGALSYLGCGFYYGSGDPVGFAPVTSDISRAQGVWILFVPLLGATGWIAARHFMDVLAGRMRLDSSLRRVGGFLLTTGIAGLAYAGLWLALRDPRIEGSTRQWRLEREIEQEVERRVLAQRPPPSATWPTPVAAPPPPVPVVRPEEVAHRVPAPWGPIVLYGTAILGALAGAAQIRPKGEAAAIRPEAAGALAALAAGVVAIFRLLG